MKQATHAVVSVVSLSDGLANVRGVIQPPSILATAAKLSSTPRARACASASKPASSADDRLSLTGLLNALDGVVDAPGRIVIMTSGAA